MGQCLFGRGSLQRVNFKETPDEVNEVFVITLQALLKSCLFGDQDVNLQLLAIFRISFIFLLALALTPLFFAVGLLVDEALTSEEV